MAVNSTDDDSRMLVKEMSSGMIVLNRYRDKDRLNLGRNSVYMT